MSDTPIFDQLLREQRQRTQWPTEQPDDTGPDQPTDAAEPPPSQSADSPDSPPPS